MFAGGAMLFISDKPEKSKIPTRTVYQAKTNLDELQN